MNDREKKEMTDKEFGERWIDSVRRSYEEGLEQPLTFYERTGNLWRVFKWKMKHRIFINWFHELPIIFRRWHHRKEGAENWIKYMEGVSRCHEREGEKRREEALIEKEFNIRIIYFDIRTIYPGG